MHIKSVNYYTQLNGMFRSNQGQYKLLHCNFSGMLPSFTKILNF